MASVALSLVWRSSGVAMAWCSDLGPLPFLIALAAPDQDP
jgi:hypothetical protein